ncbi:MAG: dinitrogenase iron-molybdenum cofactor biosynthesis protein [Coriobacteriia bacterium]|nr:dinitrogenase iron-molybdenum cofactor biosynthesis protein [Coriobacteriia bacterium]
MKVAISALEPTLESRVDERFGRAAHLLIVDTETLELEVLDNKVNQQALKGAGFGAAEAVCGHGAEAVLTGHLGPNAYKALQAAGVRGYGAATLTVREAIDRFNSASLEPLSEGESHVGM